MNGIFKNLLIFVGGAAIGSFVTWKLTKTKYEKLADEEIESVREYYRGKPENEEKNDFEPVKNPREEKPENVYEEKDRFYDNIEKAVKENKEEEKLRKEYETITERYLTPDEEEHDDETTTFPILPEQAGDCDYPIITLWYFVDDGDVRDDSNRIISNTEELIGEDFADYFDEYADDADTLYIRNDNLGADYEIIKSYGHFERR